MDDWAGPRPLWHTCASVDARLPARRPTNTQPDAWGERCKSKWNVRYLMGTSAAAVSAGANWADSVSPICLSPCSATTSILMGLVDEGVDDNGIAVAAAAAAAAAMETVRNAVRCDY